MTSNKKNYISAAFFGILSILLIVFLIYPFLGEIKKNSQNLFLQKKKIILLAQERENLKKMEDIFKTYQSDLDKIENLLVDPETPIEFISFLEKNAQVTGVELEISSMTKRTPTLPPPSQRAPEKKEPWPSLSLQLLVVGSFPNFLEFLEKLETSPYLIEILNLNSRRLTERELKSKEFEKFSLGDTSTSLSVKVYTKQSTNNESSTNLRITLCLE